ncbi:MAG: nucleotidyltransferase domain-containing protein [Deltaproteobacteria bacterium]|nr:nucleotidyltransferase domain-containing protein [Deltaproteobacteria bacterium]
MGGDDSIRTIRRRFSNDQIREAAIRSFRRFDPGRILLFGSRARGDDDPETDVDLVVVYRTDKRFIERLEELYLAWDLPVAVDILAYTPEELRKLLEERAFVQDIVAEAEVIYERPDTRGQTLDPLASQPPSLLTS